MSLEKLAPLLPIILGLGFISPVYASSQTGALFQLLSGGDLNSTGLEFTNPQGTFSLTSFTSTYNGTLLNSTSDNNWLEFDVTLAVSGSNVTVEFEAQSSTVLNTGSYVATYNLDLPPDYTFTGTTFTVTNPTSPTNFSASTSSGSTGNTITGVTSTLSVTSQNTFSTDQGFTSNYQAVPLETDALPLVGVTALFAGAVWWKRRRGAEALDLSKATPDPEQMTDIR
ncbi:MAG: hypothetical protein ACK5CA_04015 [Cyanobacteriota bacterium]